MSTRNGLDRSVSISYSLPITLVERIDEHSAYIRINRSAWVARVLREALERESTAPAPGQQPAPAGVSPTGPAPSGIRGPFTPAIVAGQSLREAEIQERLVVLEARKVRNEGAGIPLSPADQKRYDDVVAELLAERANPTQHSQDNPSGALPAGYVPEALREPFDPAKAAQEFEAEQDWSSKK